MKHISHTFTDRAQLNTVLVCDQIRKFSAQSSSILIQIYSSMMNDPEWISEVSGVVLASIPNAVLVGATSVGELAHGCTQTEGTVIGFTFFESSIATAIALPCQVGEEHKTGAELSQLINQVAPNIAGVLLLSTPLTINVPDLMSGLESEDHSYHVFGGGAGDYDLQGNALVFSGADIYQQGAVAVVMSGPELYVKSLTYLGWRSLSKEMTVTSVEGMLVKTVDYKPAFEVYRRYLDIPDDENFFLNALEFPFIVKRGGEELARVPFSVTPKGELQFVADIAEGEKFRIGYGDPSLIIADAAEIQKRMDRFNPEAIFLYTCVCRRFLMQQDVELETLPFESIAPTFGFYTYGEFYGLANDLILLNSTMVAVGLREGAAEASPKQVTHIAPDLLSPDDPYANQHARIVSRLVKFIGTVTKELEQANAEITKVSLTDSLTKLNNRMKLDSVLAKELEVAKRYQQPLSIILLDLDHFKIVNDTYGHLVGDDVLVRIAGILKDNIRQADTLGRWGGEEFLVVMPQTDLAHACSLAEKLRKAIEDETMADVVHITSSFGVSSYSNGDSVTRLLSRVDRALYEAKDSGRNRVKAQW